jgi:hypothetical protein
MLIYEGTVGDAQDLGVLWRCLLLCHRMEVCRPETPSSDLCGVLRGLRLPQRGMVAYLRSNLRMLRMRSAEEWLTRFVVAPPGSSLRRPTSSELVPDGSLPTRSFRGLPHTLIKHAEVQGELSTELRGGFSLSCVTEAITPW